MDELSFQIWCKELELTDAASELINRIRKSEPARRVGGGRKNVVGAYPSKKMGVSIQFESHRNELAGIYLKEHDINVLEYYDQPPAIKLSYNSRNDKVVGVYHTPDYFVIKKEEAGWEEWKNEEELIKLAIESPNRYVLIGGKWHCPPGEEFAQKYGLKYWLRSSAEINWILQRNFNFLEDYLLDSKAGVSLKSSESIVEAVRHKPGTCLHDLLKNNEFQVDDIYYLIARGGLYFDIENELITEPQRAHVFCDEQIALAHKIMLSSQCESILKDHSFEVVPGARVAWDGNPWSIVNLGEKNIALISDGNIIEVPREVFFGLVRDQRIKGVEMIEYKSALENPIFEESSQEELKEATLRYEIILPLIEGRAKIQDLKDLEVTTRTIRNWYNDFLHAEREFGAGFIGLIPRTKKRGNRTPRISADIYEEISSFIKKNENPANQKLKVLYGKLQEYCDQRGYILPSKKTFGKIIKKRPVEERMYSTQGSRMAYQHEDFYWEIDLTSPRHGERPFEIVHIDHTEVDLEIIHSNTNKSMGKFWLSLMVDAFTRRVLAFYITFDSPSYRSDMMLLRECVRRFNRLPQIIVTDNGRDFKSVYFQSLLARYNITHKIRPPHRARTGSICERLFGTSNTQLFHNLQGNTKIMKNVRQVTKSVNPKNHAVWTLPALYELCRDYFYEFYDTSEHSALGESPREAFERGIATAGKRTFRFIPYDEDFKIMTLPTTKSGTAKIDPQRGVKVRYLYYYCDEFTKQDLAGTNVSVRYDPWDAGVVYAFVRGKWTKCYSQYYSAFKGRSELEVRIATEELVKQKGLNASRSNISARELGEFILKAEATEELLKQRLKDLEMAPQLTVIDGGISGDKDDEALEVDNQVFNLDEVSFDLDADSEGL